MKKIHINGFEQEQLIKHNMDIKDAIILDYIIEKWTTDGYKAFETPTGRLYAIIDHDEIIKENPILKFKDKQMLRKRLNNMVKNNILIQYKYGTNNFYSINEEEYNKLICYETSQVKELKKEQNKNDESI